MTMAGMLADALLMHKHEYRWNVSYGRVGKKVRLRRLIGALSISQASSSEISIHFGMRVYITGVLDITPRVGRQRSAR